MLIFCPICMQFVSNLTGDTQNMQMPTTETVKMNELTTGDTLGQLGTHKQSNWGHTKQLGTHKQI